MGTVGCMGYVLCDKIFLSYYSANIVVYSTEFRKTLVIH